MTEDEMVGWHYRLNGHEFKQTLGDSEGQGSLVCYSPWGDKEPDMTQRLNNDNKPRSIGAYMTDTSFQRVEVKIDFIFS